MKLKLNSSKLFFNKPSTPLVQSSIQDNAYASGATIAYGTNYHMYIYDVTNVSRVRISNATALTANGQMGMTAHIADTDNLPADKTWASTDGYAPFNNLFTDKTALVSSLWSGEFILSTGEEFLDIPTGVNVLMVFTYKANGAPNVYSVD